MVVYLELKIVIVAAFRRQYKLWKALLMKIVCV